MSDETPRRRFRRRWLAVPLLLAALGWGGYEWLLRSDWLLGQIRERVLSEAERATGGNAELEQVRFDRTSLTVEVEGLRLRNEDDEVFADVPLLRLGINIESLLRQRIYVRSMTFENPTFRLRTDANGSWNLPQREVPKPEGEGEMLSLTTRVFEVRDGTAEYDGEAYGFSARADGLDLDVERDASCMAAAAFAERLEWRWGSVAAPAGELELDARLCGEALTIERAEYREGDVVVTLSGAGNGIGGQIEQLSADLDFEVAGAVGAWFERLGVEGVRGRLTAAGEFRWADGRPSYSGSARLAALSLDREEIDVDEAAVDARFAGDRRSVRLEPVTAEALGGRFEGSVRVQNPFGPRSASIEGAVAGFELRQAFAVLGVRSAPWTATLDADVAVEVSSAADWTLQSDVRLTGTPGRPVNGTAAIGYDAPSGRAEIGALSLSTDATDLVVSGNVRADGRSSFRVRLDAQSPSDVMDAARLAGLDPPERQFALLGGVKVEGEASGRLSRTGLANIRFDGSLATGAVEVAEYRWDSLSGAVRAEPGAVSITDGVLRDGDGRVEFSLTAQAPPGAALEQVPIKADVNAADLVMAKSLAAAGLPLIVEGTFSATATVSGKLGAPNLSVDLTVTDGKLWKEKFERLDLKARNEGEQVLIESLSVRSGETLVAGQGSFNRGSRLLDLRMSGERWDLSQAELFSAWDEAPQGLARFEVDAQGVLSRTESEIFERLEARGSWAIDELIWSGQSLGPWKGSLRNAGEEVLFDLNGTPMGGIVQGEAAVEFATAAAKGSAAFTGVDPRQAMLLAGLPAGEFQGEIAGALSFSGSLLEPLSVEAEGEIEKLELTVHEIPGARRGYQLYNPFPMRWTLERGVFQAEHMRLAGEGTNLEVDGDIPMWSDEAAMSLTAEGDFNLAALQSIFPDIEADGMSTLDIRATGERADPRIDGLIGVREASLRSTDFPNGLTGLEGEIRFEGREFRIEELTASSGGGRLRMGGLGHFGEDSYDFRLTADAERVRVRFPENLSSVVNGRLTLAGDETQSLLAGEIIVTRASTNAAVSLGDLLAALREPQRTPPKSSLLENLQFNVTVASGPDLDVETALIRDMEAAVDLRLVGSWVSPSLLGRIDISSGQMNFHGTRYTLNRGEIAFVNPFRVEPVLDFELETRIRNIDIALILAGPVRRLNLAYRSDPPLPFADLVNLVALGRAPTFDPVLSSQQRIQQQSLFQTGANNVFSQAVERPVSPGLQRFFGVSRLKVDPQVGGAEANPTARISTEQQITNEVTLIYTYDLSSSNQQTVRLEYAPDRTWTFVLTRDENGLVGGDILYKTRLK